MKLILLMLIMFFTALGFADGISICEYQGGECYFEHELNRGRCPNNGVKILGETLCDNADQGNIGAGASILDITGLEIEGNACCMPRDEDVGGNEDDFDNQFEGINNEGTLLFATHNAGNTRILDYDSEQCCIQEGFVPDEDEVCCQGMPRDLVYQNGNRACGCPNGFTPVPPEPGEEEGKCIPSFQRCGYIEERNVCTTFLEILRNPFECLFGGPESKEQNRGNLPYEQVCCPYIDYDKQEYYKFENVVVY